MAHYYNIVADCSVPIMMEDGQQFCVDGQNFHLVVQDVNNGVNGNTSFLTYASQENSESQVFTHQAITEQCSSTAHNQGQSVYIINSEDISLQTSTIKSEPAYIQTRDSTTNIVRIHSKGAISNESERQQGLSHLNSGVMDKTMQKVNKTRNKFPLSALPARGDASIETANNSGSQRNILMNNRPGIPTFRLKNSGPNMIPPKPSARQPIRAIANDTASSVFEKTNVNVNRNNPIISYPPLESLSERIKQARTSLDRGRQSLPLQQSYSTSGNSNVSKQRIFNQPGYVQMTPTKTAPTNYQHQRHIPTSLCSPTEKIETNISPEKNCSKQSPESVSSNDIDATSESIANLQKIIDKPANTIVQHQISGNTVKMLVVLPSGEQRLITFDLPNEDCTVLDLLEQVGIAFNGETVVSLVKDSILDINYIVESEAGTIVNLNELAESNEREVNSTTENSHASDDNSNSSVTQNEEPKFIDGKLAVCPNCGISSMDFNRCARCKKKLPSDVKQIPMNSTAQQKKEALLSIDNFYKKKSEAARLERDNTPKQAPLRRRVLKARPMKEPECLTLSSDEEEDETNGSTPKKSQSKNSTILSMSMMNSMLDEPDTILEKEPIITNDTLLYPDIHEPQSEIHVKSERNNEEGNIPNVPNEVIHNFTTSLVCRTVRIGSYKYIPRERIVINQSGLLLKVPLLEDSNSFVKIAVRFSDIIKVLIHFGKSMPVLFFYTNVHRAAFIREVLGMQDVKGPYYDPASKDHTHKRITLLPDKISEETKLICKTLFGSKHIFEELNAKEANDILLHASPRDNSLTQSMIMRKQCPLLMTNNSTVNNGRSNEIFVQKMTVYPPPPVKGGIAINTEDYACLAEDQFLNDVIIDFYLKYLTLEILSEADQQRTHVFSSYFYKRLTSRHAQTARNSLLQTPAAKRHARVQKWTKNVNIFEKDFIIIPINEHAHWFLAIICFPGLVGTVIPPPSPVKDPDSAVKDHDSQKKVKKKKEVTLQSLTIGSTTITPVATTITIDQADDDSERDEAEGDDEEMDIDSDDDEADPQSEQTDVPETQELQGRQEQGVIKSPCILIFDSLAGASRTRVVATLRDYLSCEHVAKVGTEKTFSKDTIKGGCPKVPQQSNFTDCGLYLLQYVEHFFKDPIQNYTLPIKTLKNWFEEIVVTRKREELSNLLIKLMNESNGETVVINLPSLQFPTQDGKLKPKPENSEKTELKVQKVETENRKIINEEEQSENSVQQQSDARESMPEGSTRTIYRIIPASSVLCTGAGEASSMEIFVDVKPKPSSGNNSMMYMKNKRIPRLMGRDSEFQDSQTLAKKHKGDSYDSCK